MAALLECSRHLLTMNAVWIKSIHLHERECCRHVSVRCVSCVYESGAHRSPGVSMEALLDSWDRVLVGTIGWSDVKITCTSTH